MLPADSHVHSEWSWDTGGPNSSAAGRMVATCERARSMGLPALFFTEHLDLEIMARQHSIASVITHLYYAVRSWPESKVGPFEPTQFEDEIRAAMTTITDVGLALEMNTRRLLPWVPRWWAECGGQLVTFGSDAHVPDALAHGFAEAAEVLEGLGFTPGDQPSQPWARR